jgi:dTDP-4-dehydrorhamnose 3,5-epimerase
VKFIATLFLGAYLIELDRFEDERGWFARAWCQREFAEHGLDSRLVQCNLSFNRRAGTLRGMHYQSLPYAESKLVRCVSGEIYDVIVDLRSDSESYLQWAGYRLSGENNLALFVPMGFAHGFQTLQDDSLVLYQMSEFYAPEYAQGFRYDDQMIGIRWPLPVSVISAKDKHLPFIQEHLSNIQITNQ